MGQAASAPHLNPFSPLQSSPFSPSIDIFFSSSIGDVGPIFSEHTDPRLCPSRERR